MHSSRFEMAVRRTDTITAHALQSAQGSDQDSLKLFFVLSGDSHNVSGFERTPSALLPFVDHLPNLVYRCALESAVLVNPAHDIRLYARTNDPGAFLAAEQERNPAFQVSVCHSIRTRAQSLAVGSLVAFGKAPSPSYGLWNKSPCSRRAREGVFIRRSSGWLRILCVSLAEAQLAGLNNLALQWQSFCILERNPVR